MGEPCHYRETGYQRGACPMSGTVTVWLIARTDSVGLRMRVEDRRIHLCAAHAVECLGAGLVEAASARTPAAPCHYSATGTNRPACYHAGTVGVRLTHRRSTDGRRIRTTPRQITLCAVRAEECEDGDLCEMVDMRGRALQPPPQPSPAPASAPPRQRPPSSPPRPPPAPIELEEALVEEVKAARADLARALGTAGPPPPLCDLVREVVERLTVARR